MLRLINIIKDYKVGDDYVHALKGVSLSFRKNEFVSVLGPSGCGKTTLLNIIGGLDRYTDGELFVDGISTKDFNDGDWDLYRNRRIGFIFQNYNLIPHQTILGNVELALTIAGIDRRERIERAKRALDKVGLSDQYYKMPNQLSGGQSQRVAIARALVNDPEILLADEPTGALDTVTSEQILELIKEIASERLVIMVTHNPDLAERYSTRIIKLLDGELIADSNAFSEEEEIKESAAAQKVPEEKPAQKASEERPSKGKAGKSKERGRAKMSFFTAFRLSLQNLFTKKARTIMTSVAGSIGIIGISMVLSISYGVQTYIQHMQNDMLSGNPIQITETGFDLSAMLSSNNFNNKKEALKSIKDGYVNIDSLIEQLMRQEEARSSIMLNNNITEDYVAYVKAIPAEYAAAVFLDYGINVANNIYTDFKPESAEVKNISLSALKATYEAVLKKTEYVQYSSYISGLSNAFMQLPDSTEYILSQYDLLDGKIASAENELMLVLSDDSAVADLLLAQLGYFSQDEFINLIYRAAQNPGYNDALYKERLSYAEIKDKDFVWYPNDTVFTAQNGNPMAPFSYKPYGAADFANGLGLKIAGILRPKQGMSYGSLSSGFYFTEALTHKIIESNSDSAIVRYMNNYKSTDPETGAIVDAPMKSFDSMYVQLPGSSEKTPMGLFYPVNYRYNGEDFTTVAFVGKTSRIATIANSIGSSANIPDVYSISLRELGGEGVANKISVFPVDFEKKNGVTNYLDAWNEDGDIAVNGKILAKADREKITYTDSIAIIIALINDMVNMVTIALIGFTALSLLVSTVMIGIITYVSVVERIKEIGVIRSLGGRKRDVSNLFVAETFILGTVAGLIGIGITYLLSAVISSVVHAAAGIAGIAIFPAQYAIIMVLISVGLTLISGLLPARSAARKDPVVALRTE
jgi:ABC-type antimicrobial peptide transport system, ATPase component